MRLLSSLGFLELLFRASNPDVAEESFIGFFRRAASRGMEPVGMIRVSELRQHCGTDFLNKMTRDSYYCLNPFYREPRRWPHRHGSAKELRYLTACWVDLDGIGRPGSTLSRGQAQGVISDAVEDGLLPPVSLYVNSGRGLWLLWLLRDRDDESRPPRSHDSLIRQHKRVQGAIVDRVRLLPNGLELGPDPAASGSPHQYTRMPGSTHGGSGNIVRYSLPMGESGVFFHTLDGLASAFGAKAKNPLRLIVSSASPENERKGRMGLAATMRNRVQDLELLEGHRGGFRNGGRGRALSKYAYCLVRVREEGREHALASALEACLAMAARCRSADGTRSDPYPERDARALVDAAYCGPNAPRALNRGKLAALLRVTTEEVHALVPSGFGLPSADGTDLPSSQQLTQRRPTAQARRTCLKEILDWASRHGRGHPTHGDLRARLALECFDCSEETVRKDLVMLGVVNPRAKPRGARRRAD